MHCSQTCGSMRLYPVSIYQHINLRLTELCGDDGNVMPGRLLSVQAFQKEHRSVPWMDIEQAVHVSPPVDGVPVTSKPVRKVRKG